VALRILAINATRFNTTPIHASRLAIVSLCASIVDLSETGIEFFIASPRPYPDRGDFIVCGSTCKELPIHVAMFSLPTPFKFVIHTDMMHALPLSYEGMNGALEEIRTLDLAIIEHEYSIW